MQIGGFGDYQQPQWNSIKTRTLPNTSQSSLFVGNSSGNTSVKTSPKNDIKSKTPILKWIKNKAVPWFKNTWNKIPKTGRKIINAGASWLFGTISLGWASGVISDILPVNGFPDKTDKSQKSDNNYGVTSGINSINVIAGKNKIKPYTA